MDADRIVEREQRHAANLAAMLETISECEGTNHVDGWRYLFGSTPEHPRLFDSFADHPRKRFLFRQTDGRMQMSSAAGKFQIMEYTYDALCRQFPGRWNDFSPKTQTEMTIELIRGRGAYDDVVNGRWQDAMRKLAPEWAGLPGGPYPQRSKSWQFAMLAFQKAGGLIA